MLNFCKLYIILVFLLLCDFCILIEIPKTMSQTICVKCVWKIKVKFGIFNLKFIYRFKKHSFQQLYFIQVRCFDDKATHEQVQHIFTYTYVHL